MVGTAALGIWMTLHSEGEADFNEWYPRQHLPERLSVPGFLRGRRYAAGGDGLPYFTLYETTEPGILSSAAYLERLNDPTPWTRRVLPRIRIMVRNAYRLLAATPADRVERAVLTVRIEPDSGRGPHVRRWLEAEAAVTVAEVEGVAGCGLYVSETGGTSVVTEERRLVGGEVLPAPPFLALCELRHPEAGVPVGGFWDRWAKANGAAVTVDAYRLMYGLAWL
jgi:hypothetical protein